MFFIILHRGQATATFLESKMALKTVLKQIEELDIHFVRFEFSDMYGIARSRIVSARHFREKAKGLHMPSVHFAMDPQGTIAEQAPYGESTGFGDCVWFPDLESFRVIPWCNHTAEVLIEPTLNHKPLMCFPRYIARKQLEKLADLGYSLLSTNEYEFYVVDGKTKEPLTDDGSIRSTLRNYTDPELVEDLLSYVPYVGVDVEMCDSKNGPGQMEMTYKSEFGIRAADNAHVFKTSVKEIAQRRGYTASFMSKPWLNQCDSSGHFCHSLWDTEENRNLLYDPKSKTGLSDVAQHWMAGILIHAPAISILMAPTVNCLRRFKKFNFVTSNATWGFDNRTCALRVKLNGEKGTYLENRMGASGSNPYLCMAAVIAAGIDGIQRKLPLQDKVTGSAFDESNLPPGTINLPANMDEAVKAFLADGVIRDAFGTEFRNAFLALKRHEIKLAHEAEEDNDKEWERNMFFKYL